MSKQAKIDPDKLTVEPIKAVFIEGEQEEELFDPFTNLHKNSPNLYNSQCYEDDHFKLLDPKTGKGVVKKRLRDIFKIGTSLKEGFQQSDKDLNEWPKDKFTLSHPSYLSEMHMLPQWHFLSLIEPQQINEHGFYHVAVVKSGRIIKKTIDDYIYYDENAKQISCNPLLENKAWVHIILKVWAKLNGGYENLALCSPFSFLRAFTFPDWSIFNPGLQSLESIINRFSSTSNQEYFYVAKTKEHAGVGYYGLVPNCASYQITGYHQEYGNIFIKVLSLVGDRWNGRCLSSETELPTELLQRSPNQFIMPLKQFVNLFHLVYITTNKYLKQKRVHYNQFSINLDARESKAKIIRFEVLGDKPVEESINLNINFSEVKVFDLSNKRASGQQKDKTIPFCKILIGHQIEHYNNEGSYADSVREKILKNEVGQYLSLNNLKYEYIMGDYFKGYCSDVTYHLKLKPGLYILRLKIEKIFPEYRAILNITSSREVAISEGKMTKNDQNEFLTEIFSNKSRKEEKNVVVPNPAKKQSWLMVNDDFQTMGYGSILFQVGKNDSRTLTVNIDAQKLKENGYRIKNKMELVESKYQIRLKEAQSAIIILKYELQWEGTSRKWPPEGIELVYSVAPRESFHFD